MPLLCRNANPLNICCMHASAALAVMPRVGICVSNDPKSANSKICAT